MVLGKEDKKDGKAEKAEKEKAEKEKAEKEKAEKADKSQALDKTDMSGKLNLTIIPMHKTYNNLIFFSEERIEYWKNQ